MPGRTTRALDRRHPQYSKDEAMDTSTYHFKVGRIDCTAVSDGQFTYAPPLFPPPASVLFANAPPDRCRQVLQGAGLDPQAWVEWTSP